MRSNWIQISLYVVCKMDVGFVRNKGKFKPKSAKSGTFSAQGAPKCTESDLKTIPNLCHLWQIWPNLDAEFAIPEAEVGEAGVKTTHTWSLDVNDVISLRQACHIGTNSDHISMNLWNKLVGMNDLNNSSRNTLF